MVATVLYAYRSNAKIIVRYIYEHIQWCLDNDANYVLHCDHEFPPLLKSLSQAPVALTIVGNPLRLHGPTISVVGSRRTARVVLRKCHSIGEQLAKLGFLIVSGGAYGCDISTHRGVLDANMDPVPAAIVFANGLKDLFPQGNRPAFQQVANGGGILISERLWDQKPKPYDFPVRNRIISGLSMWTLVMGATRRSGAMVTARLALDQGRDVAVFMSESGAYYCEGSNELIEDGACSFANEVELKEVLLA